MVVPESYPGSARSQTASALIAIGLTAACGVQLGAGTTPLDIPSGRKVYLTTAIQTQRIRENGSVVGLRMTTFPDPSGLKVRNAVLGVGWDWHVGASSPFGAEAVGELGAGNSAFSELPGVGMYTGGAVAPRLRLYGNFDRQPGYALIVPNLELVAVGRGGFWFPAEAADRSRPDLEFALELALRVTLASDLVNGGGLSVIEDNP